MRIKKGENLLLFFDLFIGAALAVLITFSFFLGFEINEKNLTVYIMLLVALALIQAIVYLMYRMCCRKYYVFSDNEVRYLEKNKTVFAIRYSQIRSIRYYRLSTLLLGGSSAGGNLVIRYHGDAGKEERIEIPFPYRRLSDLPLSNIVVC